MSTKMYRLTTPAALAAVLIVPGACEPPPAEVAGIQRAMNGEVTLIGCDPFEAIKIADAAQRAAQRVRNDPAAMRECMKDAILSFENWNVNPAYPEDIIARVGDNYTTRVACWELDGANGTATSEFPFVTETLALDRDFIFNSDVNRVAAVLVHEVSHTRSYKHPEFNYVMGAESDFSYTVPEQLEECMNTLLNTGTATPHGKRRSSFTGETTLSKVGGLSGTIFELGCPGNTFGYALKVRTGSLVDNIGLGCRSPNGVPVNDTATAGGGGGSPARLECFPGELLVGLHGRAGTQIDAVGPICASVDVVRNGGTAAFRDPPAGGGGGLPWDRQCPPYMALSGLRGKSGALVDSLELECKNTWQFESPSISNIARVAPPATGYHHKSLERCTGRSALVGLTVGTGDYVDRVGGLCREVATSTYFNIDTLRPGVSHIMAANGGKNGTGNQLPCGPGQAVVGLHGRSGSWIDAVGPVCADTVRWTDWSYPYQTQDGPVAGGGGGWPYRTMCARGSFLVGWEASFSIAGVFTLVPQCRDFWAP